MSTPLATPPIHCPAPETLGKLLREELDPTEVEPVEEHVGVCPSCQRMLGQLVGSLPDALTAHGRAADEEPPVLPGYAPLGRIDAGGMGVVWRVRDLQFDRDLAVKVMASWGSASPRLVERFFAEARICAQLTHPFIVPVHSMSRLPDGRPYYTMKLVEGRTLAALLEAGPAPAEKRMELVQIFGKVCQALAFAHGRGVIHRDLKPENVMVGAHGEVQLMDWGLAKVLADPEPGTRSGEGADSTAIEPEQTDGMGTRAGSVLGTAAYMAPEQAQGLIAEVDRQSDVFGLGGILCRILTGEPPYTGPDAGAVRRRAVEADLTETQARLRGCGADAELIQLPQRCLAARKADRPTDAGAVAAEVAAYISGVEERLQQERLRREREQVQAAEERRRRRLWMGLAAAVLVAMLFLAGGLAMVNHLRGKERAAKDLAQQREQETRTVLDDLSSTVIDDWLARQQKLTPEQKEFLKKGLAYYENFTQETGQTPEGRSALAMAHRRVGIIRRELGMLPEAEAAFGRAVELTEALVQEFPSNTAYERQAAGMLETQAIICQKRGDYRKAAAHFAEAIRYLQDAVQKDSGDAVARAMLANLHHGLGNLQKDLRQFDEAETSLKEALTIQKELVEAFPTDPAHQKRLAATLGTRGLLSTKRRKFEEAEDSYRQSLPIWKKMAADFPQVNQYKVDLAAEYVNLSIVLAKTARLHEAQDALGSAVSVFKTLVEDFPSIPRYRDNLASCYNNRSIVLKDLRKLDEAEAVTRQAIALREALVKEFPEVLDYAVRLGAVYNNLASLIQDQGRPADSLEWFDKAIRILEPIVAQEGRHDFARDCLRASHAGQAEALDRLGRHKDSIRNWERASALADGTRSGFYKSQRALLLGDQAQAVALAREQAQVTGVSSETLYRCARICGLAAAAVEEDAMLRERYGDCAIELLRRAVAAGYSSNPHSGPRADQAFHSLRQREEFQHLAEQLEAGTPAPNPGRK